MSNYTVSIFMLTYNQEGFIAQTIESILMQKTTFNYQLVIGEDCSTDATRAVCEKYAIQYANKIKLLPALDKNIGLIANYIRTINECDGKFIAVCDGDDYWIDEYKLQKQVNFLDQNQDYTIVYARTQKLYQDGSLRLHDAVSNDFEKKGFDDIIFRNFIPSVTSLFRNPILTNSLPYWFKYLPYGDWPIYMMATCNGGKIKLLNDIVSVYRMDIGESFKLSKQFSKSQEENLKILNFALNDKLFTSNKNIIRESIFKYHENLMFAYNREKKVIKGLKELLFLVVNRRISVSLLKMYIYSIYLLFYKKSC